jgi:hypothetical protein
MALHRPTYLVEVLTSPDADNEGTVYEVKVLYGDQMRAELEAGKNGIQMGPSTGFAITGLWVWAAMARLGWTEHKWQTFAPLIAAVEKVGPDPAVTEGEADPSLDPTRPGVPTISP